VDIKTIESALESITDAEPPPASSSNQTTEPGNSMTGVIEPSLMSSSSSTNMHFAGTTLAQENGSPQWSHSPPLDKPTLQDSVMFQDHSRMNASDVEDDDDELENEN